ncbi:hypothetical protein D3C80_2138930 [compost metagenome]
MSAPGMAAAYAFQGHPATLKRAIFFNRLQPVLRAGGGIAAIGSKPGREQFLVHFYNAQYNFSWYAHLFERIFYEV